MSKRQERRAKRNFRGSRPNRRAERRLNEAMGFYNTAVARSATGGIEFTKPGAMKRW